MSQDDLYNRAEKKVDDKIGFYKHLYSYITVNVILIIINVLTSPGKWWFYWVTVFWGIGLVGHFFKTFVLSEKLDDNREQMIEDEIRKMKK